MKIDRIHHVAYRCKDAKETVLWYRDVLKMDFVLAIAEDQVPSTKAARPVHARVPRRRQRQRAGVLRAADAAAMGRDPNTPDMGAAHRLQGQGPRRAARRQGAPGGQRRRGARRRPTTASSSRSTSSIPTATGSSWPAPIRDEDAMIEQARRGEVGHARGLVEDQARAEARRLPAPAGVQAHDRRALDATHDPALRSWVESANDRRPTSRSRTCRSGASARQRGDDGSWRIGVAIGDQRARSRGGRAVRGPRDMNALMRMAPQRASRAAPSASRGPARAAARRRRRASRAACRSATWSWRLPCRIGDYTDFYTGIHHATAVGKLFRPDNPLLPNYKWVPIGYHGRASSIVAERRTTFPRPLGQAAGADGKARRASAPSRAPRLRARARLLRRPAQRARQPIPIAAAEEHLFGVAPVQRLERARHPGLGVPAARARSCRRTSLARCRRGS